MSMSTTGIYKNRVTTTHSHGPLTSDLGYFAYLRCLLEGRFQGSYYCSNMKVLYEDLCHVLWRYPRRGHLCTLDTFLFDYICPLSCFTDEGEEPYAAQTYFCNLELH